MVHLPRPPRLPEPTRRALTFWRRSIQARVVISTVLLSAVVFSVVGWFLLQQTRDGLLENRVDAVVTEANGGTAAARKLLDSAVGTDSDADTQRQQLAATIIQRCKTR